MRTGWNSLVQWFSNGGTPPPPVVALGCVTIARIPPPVSRRSGVGYNRTHPPPPPVSRRSGVGYDRAHLALTVSGEKRGGWGGVRAIVTQRGPTTGGGGGWGARARAIITHHGPMTGGVVSKRRTNT